MHRAALSRGHLTPSPSFSHEDRPGAGSAGAAGGTEAALANRFREGILTP